MACSKRFYYLQGTSEAAAGMVADRIPIEDRDFRMVCQSGCHIVAAVGQIAEVVLDRSSWKA